MTSTAPRPLVLGEVAKIEELSGTSANDWDDHAPQGKLLAALVFVYKRREDKKFTWNDALGLGLQEAGEYLKTQGFGVDDVEADEDGEDDDDDEDTGDVRPTKPARKPANRSRAASKTSARSSASSD